MKRIALLCTCLLLLILAQQALAMSSAHYRLDWFIPLTAGGGGKSASTHYSINDSVGQTVMGYASSSSFAAHLGYWFGVIIEQFSSFLPNVIQ